METDWVRAQCEASATSVPIWVSHPVGAQMCFKKNGEEKIDALLITSGGIVEITSSRVTLVPLGIVVKPPRERNLA